MVIWRQPGSISSQVRCPPESPLIYPLAMFTIHFLEQVASHLPIGDVHNSLPWASRLSSTHWRCSQFASLGKSPLIYPLAMFTIHFLEQVASHLPIGDVHNSLPWASRLSSTHWRCSQFASLGKSPLIYPLAMFTIRFLGQVASHLPIGDVHNSLPWASRLLSTHWRCSQFASLGKSPLIYPLAMFTIRFLGQVASHLPIGDVHNSLIYSLITCNRHYSIDSLFITHKCSPWPTQVGIVGKVLQECYPYLSSCRAGQLASCFCRCVCVHFALTVNVTNRSRVIPTYATRGSDVNNDLWCVWINLFLMQSLVGWSC